MPIYLQPHRLVTTLFCLLFFSLGPQVVPYGRLGCLIFVIWIGLGHFMLTLLYQWRAGKANPLFMLGFAGYFLLLSAVPYFWGFERANQLLFMFAAVHSIIHFTFDDLHLSGGHATPVRWLEVWVQGVMFVAFIFYKVFGVDWVLYAGALAAGMVMLRLVLAWRGYRLDSWSLYCGILAGIFFAALPFYQVIGTLEAYSILATLHFLNWGVAYYKRITNDPVRLKRYATDTIVIHAVLAVLLVMYFAPAALPGGILSFRKDTVLLLLFHPVFFYIWVLCHVMFTSRTADFLSLRWRAA